MKIRFFGTSHGVPHGVAGAERYCQSMLIETKNSSFIVDAGAPVMDGLLRINHELTKLKAVFITHSHSDHMDYLSGLMTLPSWYYKEMKFDVFMPDQAGYDAIDSYLKAMGRGIPSFPNDRIVLKRFFEPVVYQDEEVTVTAFPTGHMDHYPPEAERQAYGYLFEAEGKRLYITGDLNGARIDIPDFMYEEGADTMIVECAHFPAERLIERMKTCRVKRVMPVHVWTLDKYDVMREAEKELPFKMEYPNDGDCFEI